MNENVYKCTVVGDAYITNDIMEDTVEEFTNMSLNASVFWGERSKQDMRVQVRKIETGGAYALKPPEKLYDSIRDTEILLVHLCPIHKDLMEICRSLKVIASARGGVENIDVDSATERGIAVISNPAHNANAVAEMTVGLMIAESRNIGRSYSALREKGKWREDYPNAGNIRELTSMKVGLVGYGSIGQLVAEKLKNFGSEILIADPFVPDRDIIDSGYVPVALETLLKEVDIVSLHTRVNKDTIHMIGAEQLSLMKPNAYLINTSRAALVDTQALYQALKDKVILGAAIDVYDEEPIDGSHPLLSLDNVTCTNHRGGDTVESYINSPRMVLKEVNRYLNGERPRFWANAGNLPKMIFKEKK